jgi:hypothetical protein
MSKPANDATASAQETADRGTTTRVRKPYATPNLEALGDIRDLTLGGSKGAGDSGGMPMKT